MRPFFRELPIVAVGNRRLLWASGMRGGQVSLGFRAALRDVFLAIIWYSLYSFFFFFWGGGAYYSLYIYVHI